MKKYLKGILAICFMMVLALPLIFVGCSKTPTIKLSIESGQGSILRSNVGMNDDSTTAESVLGKQYYNSEGRFQFFIKPDEGYYIKDIVIDGESLTDEYSPNGTTYSFTDQKSHTVKVYFDVREWTITLHCVDAVYDTFTLKHGENLDLNQHFSEAVNEAASWYFVGQKNRVYLESGVYVNIRSNLDIWTELTTSELLERINSAQ